jgi:hypothetical protein
VEFARQVFNTINVVSLRIAAARIVGLDQQEVMVQMLFLTKRTRLKPGVSQPAKSWFMVFPKFCTLI